MRPKCEIHTDADQERYHERGEDVGFVHTGKTIRTVIHQDSLTAIRVLQEAATPSSALVCTRIGSIKSAQVINPDMKNECNRRIQGNGKLAIFISSLYP